MLDDSEALKLHNRPTLQLTALLGYYSLVFTHNIVTVVLITVVYVSVWVAIRLQRRRMEKMGRRRNEIDKTLDVR